MKDAMIRCAHCERPKAEHRLVNFADGPMVGAPALVCPTAVFLDSWETREDHTHHDRALFDALEAAQGKRVEVLDLTGQPPLAPDDPQRGGGL